MTTATFRKCLVFAIGAVFVSSGVCFHSCLERVARIVYVTKLYVFWRLLVQAAPILEAWGSSRHNTTVFGMVVTW